MKIAVILFFLSSLYSAWNPGNDNSGIVLYNDATTYRWTESQEKTFQSWKHNTTCHHCHKTIYAFDSSLTTKQDTIHTYCKDGFLKTHSYLK